MGYFLVPNVRKLPSVRTTTNNGGTLTVPFVAGYVGGRARVIASASIDGKVLAETVLVAYAVPGLVSLKGGQMPDTDVYWIGGTTDHPQGLNFYVQDSIASRLRPIAESLQTRVNGQKLYLQFNDASLVQGGTFTVQAPSPVSPAAYENPFRASPGHLAHDTGLDQDIGLCYTTSWGDDGQVHRVAYSSCTSNTTQTVNLTTLKQFACQEHGVAQVHGKTVNNVFIGTHYHIRFVGSNENAPGC